MHALKQGPFLGIPKVSAQAQVLSLAAVVTAFRQFFLGQIDVGTEAGGNFAGVVAAARIDDGNLVNQWITIVQFRFQQHNLFP